MKLCAMGLLATVLCRDLSAQAVPPSPAEWLRLERIANPAIAPDARTIAYERWAMDSINGRPTASVWLIDADGAHPRRVAQGRQPRWSEDAKRIVTLRDGDSTGLRIHWLDGTGASTVLADGYHVDAANWAPDGRRIAFTAFITDSTAYATRQVIAGKRRTAGKVRLFVVSDANDVHAVTDTSLDVGGMDVPGAGRHAFAWVDSNTIVFDANPSVTADREFRRLSILTVDVRTGVTHALVADSGFWHDPVVSPDGKWIAYTGIPYTGASYQAEQLFVIRTDGTAQRSLTRSFDRDPVSIAWSPDNQSLWFSAEDRGTVNVFTVPLNGGTVKPATNGVHMILMAEVARRDGFGVAVRSSGDAPSELVRFATRKAWDLRALTHGNEDIVRTLNPAAAEETEFRSASGDLLRGWMYRPVRSALVPVAIMLHDGVHAMWNPGFDATVQRLASAGIAVLLLNPRGSTGSGSAFGDAIAANHPGIVQQDIDAALDLLASQPWVDTTRFAIVACGQGAERAAWAVGHSRRFASAVLCSPVSEWLADAARPQSLSSAQLPARPYRRSPAIWWLRAPLSFVQDIATPTLFIQSELDVAAPRPETEELYVDLTARGIATRLLRLPGEFRGPYAIGDSWLRATEEMARWIRRDR